MVKVLIHPQHTRDPAHARIAQTQIGQAHIAGTGPDTKTCRECVFFGVDRGGEYEWFSFQPNSRTPGALKDGECHKKIENKAAVKISHLAKACVFFEAAPHTPVAQKPNPITKDTK
jgi:hypothetical protein